MAGGPRCDTELEVIEFVHDGMQNGAIGLNLGRNVWQSPHPVAIMRALRAVIHENYSVKEAWDLFNSVKQEK
jgi:putative autoinducer-2 (AI-2) aldolase